MLLDWDSFLIYTIILHVDLAIDSFRTSYNGEIDWLYLKVIHAHLIL